ncbi:hypothetical protein [Desulfosarcina sp.]|uniref:hypothetical protein n=1 Tax=Desulfosarcina sp. TaxID=2027861 RepID=UPI003970D1AD
MKKAVESNQWPALFGWMLCWLACSAPFFHWTARCHASEAVCAEVKIEIKQELTLERQAFDAHLRIKNGLGHISLEDVSIAVHFSDADGHVVQATADPADRSARFFIRVDSMTNIGNVNGTGTVAPSTSADIHWLIIPAPGASNGLSSGTLYYVGATLTYSLGGEAHTTEVTPDYIHVKPMPQITLDYFLPTEVYGDDAFTEAIEASLPFSLGVRVKNSGHGTARQLKIASAQPHIAENEHGLLIGFSIQGSQVNGQTATPSLLADFGDISPGSSGMARWIITCTLSGRLVKFEADFSHSDELGGELTSLIDAVATHLLVRDVRVDVAGRDSIQDFLARDGDIFRVYESESVDAPVTDTSAASTLQYKGLQDGRIAYSLSTPVDDGFIYVRLPDPFNGNKAIHAAFRGDGKQIKPDNVWLSKTRDGQNWKYWVNLFDAASTGSYTVSFADPVAMPEAPVLQPVENVVAVEGQRIGFIVQASDPDGTMPVLSAAPLPAGAAFSDAGDGSAVFEWTPAVGQAGTYPVAFKAFDGVLADTRQVQFSIRSIHDSDGDGINDAWEMAYFGSLDRDGGGDFDGDGISDLDEFLTGSDPTAADHAPSMPVIVSPARDEPVATLTPQLVIENSTDADGDGITYEFEVYADPRFTRLTAADHAVAETTATTAWSPPVELTENQHYFWRVRATDGYSYSLWVYGRFWVNAANDPPGGLAVSFPPDGADVDSLTPQLEVSGAADPDDEGLTCSIEIYADEALTLPVTADHGLVVPGDGTVRWTVEPPLDDNTRYYWRAIVLDGQGLASATAPAAFTVDTTNRAPTAPTIGFPADGAEISAIDVELSVANAVDADGDALWYYFEIDPLPGFSGADKQASVMIGEGLGVTACPVANLTDNTTYYWRARATDTAAPSRWVVGRFFVNTANDGPDEPVLKNPGQAAWVGVLAAELALADGADADRDSLTYRYEVYTEPTLDNLVAWGETPSTRWSVVTDLTDKTRYYWRARATDEHGLDGNWMPTASFFVREEEPLQPDTIAVVVATDKGRFLEGVRVYAYTASGSYAGVYATTGSDGKALFDIDALAPSAYQFRADVLGSRFWSEVVALPDSLTIPIEIAEERVAVTVHSAAGVVTGVRVYLYSDSGAYLGQYLQTDASGQVFFDLPESGTYQFRADVLGSRYWSAATIVVDGGGNTADVDAGGGRLHVVVQQDEITPMSAIRVYLFNGGQAYLGVSAATDEAGQVSFNVTEGDYRLRADYLGYRFWSEPVHVVTDTTQTIRIAHQSSRVSVQGLFGDAVEPMPGVTVYLFSGSNAYLGQTLKTDLNGQARFDLPQQDYRVRADYLGGQYWSEAFTWEDPSITIPLADARVTVSGAGRPKEGALVYVFSESGSYLGIHAVTDADGQTSFRLPEGSYDFRADFQGSQFWDRERVLAGGGVNDVDIAVGGGTFLLTVKTDDDVPLVGLKCHVFNENEVYLGLAASTGETGSATFDLADGAYRFRVDYLGHQFWSEPVAIPGSVSQVMAIPATQVRVQVIASQTAVHGVKVHLFSEAEAYLGRYATTDINGQVQFDLPSGITFRFRADILGSHYWSGDVAVAQDMSPVVVDAGGGRMRVTVQTDSGRPFAGLKVYLFSENGAYLGLSAQTVEDGSVEFSVPEGTYRVRTNTLGYSFWQESIQVFSDVDVVLTIALQPVAVSVVGDHQGVDTALAGIPTHLFSHTGAYLGIHGDTDVQGRVVFDLPDKPYMVRVDYSGSKFWSDPFNWVDPTVRIPIADAVVSVTGAGLPAAGVKVYLFSAGDAYLGRYATTDETGAVRFWVPAGSFKFRADYQASHYWSEVAALAADAENQVLISVGGGNVSLTLERDAGAPMFGINCYAFSESGAYLGLKGATGHDGRVAFDLANGTIRFRADYLGYPYWSGVVSIPDTLAQTMVIDHTDVTVTLHGDYQGVIQPLDGRRAYLFSPSGAYLGQYRTTDAAGRAVFSLPDQPYQVRCDNLGQQYWSDDFQAADTTVTIYQGKVAIHVTRSGESLENARVYLFSATDSYLGRYENTDGGGNVQFILPEGRYRFRTDLDGRQQWSDVITIAADLETALDVILE